MDLLDNYIFLDNDRRMIDSAGLRDEEAAEDRCIDLAKGLGETVTCYKEICVIDPTAEE